ncbi:MAG TPA: EAL domain-containing protein, partial [Thermoanaerobaculia bacterium]|nr:EAL domain-containing protein [Thermoanaerobaculia bacterium]
LFWTIPCLVVIAVGAALAVGSLHDYADGRRQNQIVLDDVDWSASEIRIEEEGDKKGRVSVRASLLDDRLLASLAALGQTDPHGEAAENVREAAGEYLRNARQHARLVHGGDPTAEEWQQRRSAPSYALLVDAVNEAQTFYSAQAARALRRARIGSTAAIGGQALLIGLLIFATQRMKTSSELRLAEERVRKEALFRSLVQNSSDVIAIVDAAAAIRYLSPAVWRVLGYVPEGQLAQECFACVHPEDMERARLTFSRALDSTEGVVVEQLRVRHTDGTWRWIEVCATNLLADSNVGGIVLNFRDISDRRVLEEQLRHQALTDPLTQLANRALFQNLLERALAAANRGQSQVAVFFLDLDDFKQINDGLGHEAGDQLLCEIASRLRATLRAEDAPARLGGDEFAVLVPGLDDSGLTALAERILGVMSRPFRLGEQEVTVSMSIGIALNGPREYTAGELLRDADVALYAAKGSGKGRFEIFEDGMYRRVRHNLEMEMDLRRALELGEFELHYQPIVALDDDRVIGVEALVRWRDASQRRVVMPGEFLPLAEQTGLILPLGRWILESACAQVQEWQLRYPDLAPVFLNVNLSARQFKSTALLQEIERALEHSGLPSSQLVLEVPESVLLQDPEVTKDRLTGLRRLGVRVAIDNFGGGYFALSYLHRFPIDIVKIHNCFVEGVTVGDSELTRGLIELARRLNLQTLAGGIEEPCQARALDDMGCELGQGYSLSHPLGAQGIEDLLASAEGGVCYLPRTPELAMAAGGGRR